MSANRVKFQMGANAVRYASSSTWYAFSRTSASGKCTCSSNLSKASWTSLMNCCVWSGYLARGVTHVFAMSETIKRLRTIRGFAAIYWLNVRPYLMSTYCNVYKEYAALISEHNGTHSRATIN